MLEEARIALLDPTDSVAKIWTLKIQKLWMNPSSVRLYEMYQLIEIYKNTLPLCRLHWTFPSWCPFRWDQCRWWTWYEKIFIDFFKVSIYLWFVHYRFLSTLSSTSLLISNMRTGFYETRRTKKISLEAYMATSIYYLIH